MQYLKDKNQKEEDNQHNTEEENQNNLENQYSQESQDNQDSQDYQDNQENKAFKSTEEMVGAIEESIKMVKEERKNLIQRNNTGLQEFNKDSMYGMQQESKMEEIISSSCNQINTMLVECGIQSIEAVIYPQFCKMLNAEQLKDAIKNIIAMKTSSITDNEVYEHTLKNANSQIKHLETENHKLKEQSTYEKNKSYSDMSTYYNSQISSLNGTLQKYKSALEIEVKKEKNYKESVIYYYRTC